MAQDDPARTLFTNIHIFDGVNEQRVENASVLIEDNLITEVSIDPIVIEGRTVSEIEAAVEIAEQYGTYVMAHSYKKGIGSARAQCRHEVD